MMKFMGSLIVVEDIEKSRYLYEKILGQTVKFDFGENVTFKGDFAIHQKSHFQNLIDNKPVLQRSNSCELYFEHNDLIPVVQELKKLDVEFIHEIKEQPWQQQVIRFYDFDKNLIEIGESMEHVAYRLSKRDLSIDEIAKITYLEPAAVQSAILEYTSNFPEKPNSSSS